MDSYPALSVLFAPAVVLASALLVHLSTLAWRALTRALGWRPPPPRDPRQLPPARMA